MCDKKKSLVENNNFLLKRKKFFYNLSELIYIIFISIIIKKDSNFNDENSDLIKI